MENKSVGKLAEKLNILVEKYETKDFIKDDPVQFPHRYSKKEDVEIAGFISSLLAYGKREAFIKKLESLFSLTGVSPSGFILNYPDHERLLDGFVYRFVKDADLKCLFNALSKLYREKSSLEELFSKGTQHVADYFYENALYDAGMGYYHLIPNPKKGGAQKRFNMYLRWMVRSGPVDLGLWDFIKPSELLIPLDVHVGKVSRSMSLLKRSANDFKAVFELTQKLKEFDPVDPVKYDFALFGAGVDKILNS